ncbi:hypothetical protein HZH68_009148 [Vespula germanica]|uniref:Uncharacterized protein n=1 Tax=Vespula germanica TaxID=30212 RepID=A0A834K0M2_VESGE|nr:hypothetical protein HZH68_009148 [Vespula germanica]
MSVGRWWSSQSQAIRQLGINATNRTADVRSINTGRCGTERSRVTSRGLARPILRDSAQKINDGLASPDVPTPELTTFIYSSVGYLGHKRVTFSPTQFVSMTTTARTPIKKLTL